jgi:hypothetical protein
LEVRLDAVALTGCVPARRPGGGDLQTAVGDSLDLLLGELAALGFCQPDGTFITSLYGLRHRAVVYDQELEVVAAVQVGGARLVSTSNTDTGEPYSAPSNQVGWRPGRPARR